LRKPITRSYVNLLLAVLLITAVSPHSFAAELLTNATSMADAPSWVDKTRVDKVADKIQQFLEWSIRRVKVIWYKDQVAFERMHGLGSSAVLAISRKADNSIHLGPERT
jgi:hypothetical protein